MNFRRSAILIALALAFAGCHDEEFVTVVSGPPPTNFAAPSSATGLTGFNEAIRSADVGNDGQPRLVFVRTVGSNMQVMFTRRNATGTWTTPLAISGSNTNAKDTVIALVTSNNNYTHIFWLEAGAAHYTRVDDAATPAVDSSANNLVLSTPSVAPLVYPPSNVSVTATFGSVTAVAAAVDRSTNNVYAAWVQSIDDDGAGGGAADMVPVVGAVLAGAGQFQEVFALVDPNNDGNGALVSLPITLVFRFSAQGIVHAAWVGPDQANANNALRHSVRTAAGTWSGGAAGDMVSNSGTILFGDLLLASDGDAYAVWGEGGTAVWSAYRAVGDASTFGAPLVAASPLTDVDKVDAALEPGTEYLHAFWMSTPTTNVTFSTSNHSTANLGGTWSGAEDLLGPVTAAGVSTMEAWADSNNFVVFVCQAPPVEGEVSRVLLRTRPTGQTSVYSTTSDLTASVALPCSNLSVAANGSGAAILAWQQGDAAVAPLAEICGMIYASGGGVGGAANVSQSSGIASVGPVLVQMTDSNAGHVFWHETTAVGLRDISYALTQ